MKGRDWSPRGHRGRCCVPVRFSLKERDPGSHCSRSMDSQSLQAMLSGVPGHPQSVPRSQAEHWEFFRHQKSRAPENIFFVLIYLFFWPHHVACKILAPQPGIEPVPPALGARSLNHWTTREVSRKYFLKSLNFNRFKHGNNYHVEVQDFAGSTMFMSRWSVVSTVDQLFRDK